MKKIKFVCMLAVMGLMTMGLSGLAMADAPAADFYKTAGKAKKGINYPAYLYARGQRGEAIYKKFIKPAKGYAFTEKTDMASHLYTPEW